jgi:predicted nucleotidyltransferase
MIDIVTKNNYIKIIKKELSKFSEIHKIIIFGSFNSSDNPNDIDVAVLQDSNSNFLTLSLKYRKVLRELSKKISLDIVPLRFDSKDCFSDEIISGKVIYEKRY